MVEIKGTLVDLSRPLFQHWPLLAQVLACEPLAGLPTPVRQLVNIHPQRAWMKCDNLSHPVYGGNKIRKLEFIIPELKRKKIRQVITLGGSGSNSGVAVAMVCQQLGIGCRIYTFPQQASETVQKNNRLMQTFAATLVPVQSAVSAGLHYYLNWRRLHPHYYFLYAGCSNTVSVFGYVNAMLELKQQVDAGLCPAPDRIVVATGSCSTLAGLLLGSALLDWPVAVTGVRVAPDYVGPVPGCTPGLVTQLMKDALQLMQQLYPQLQSLVLPEPQLTGAYYRDGDSGGYGVPTAASEAAMALAWQREQLSLEATYTAKAFAAFLDTLVGSEGHVLFWNTHNSQPYL